jgi:hypothetical protein
VLICVDCIRLVVGSFFGVDGLYFGFRAKLSVLNFHLAGTGCHLLPCCLFLDCSGECANVIWLPTLSLSGIGNQIAHTLLRKQSVQGE